jgi:hypothetical protein
VVELTQELREQIKATLGANFEFGPKFTIYIPNKRRSSEGEAQVPLENWDGWVRRAMDVLGQINGGATACPPTNGYYVDQARGNELVWEQTILVYSFIDMEEFPKRLDEVLAFLHTFGRDANQGAVLYEFDGESRMIEPPYSFAE